MKHISNRWLNWSRGELLLLALVTLGVSCNGTKPLRYQIQTLPQIPHSTQVRLVGIQERESGFWMNGEWEQVWRQAATDGYEVLLEGGKAAKVLDRNDKIWKTWLDTKKADRLVILGVLPDAGPHREKIPLDKQTWDGAKQLELLVHPGRFEVRTAPK